jgi:phytoene desaturase
MARTRAAVIGSGFGGLTLAVRLQAAGVETTLIEGRDSPGGRAYVYQDGEFKFDGGPTVITAPEALNSVFRAAGREMSDYVEMLPVKPFYRLLWEDGYAFDYSNDVDVISEQIARKNPRDVDGYARFLKYVEAVFEEGYVKLANVPFLDFRSMIRVSPQLMRLQSFRSVYSIVSRFVKDPHLRQVFSFHSLLVGGNPFSCSSIYTLIHQLERKWGVFFARGGTGALVEGYLRLFAELGGELRLDCPVERIRTSNGRVTGLECGDGWSGDFDLVASNADVVHTYDRLLRDEPRAAPVARGLRNKRFSMSLFVIYFGTRRRHPQLAHHSVLFGPRYRGLLDDIFENGKLADDFSLYLHAPSVTDPGIAPAGCEAFYVLSPVPHLGKADIDWKTEGPRYRDRILAYLEQRYIPGLSDDLETTRIFTPEDFRDSLNAHHGSAFSLEPTLRQSAYFRVHNRDSRIGGLYFVGAGTHPGAGVPGVINSADATAGLIFSDLGLEQPASARA